MEDVMPAWAVPAIEGVATLGGAALGGKAAKNAAKIQAQTADKALAFERERETARRGEYDKAMAAYEQKWNAWNEMRNALLGRYGISVSPRVPMSPGQPVRGASTPIMSAQAPVAPPQSIRTMMQPPEALDSWNNWERRGLA